MKQQSRCGSFFFYIIPPHTLFVADQGQAGNTERAWGKSQRIQANQKSNNPLRKKKKEGSSGG